MTTKSELKSSSAENLQTLRYSRVAPQGDGRRYLPSTAILLVEVIKLVFSLSIISCQISETGRPRYSQRLGKQIYQSLFLGDSWKLMIPAALWTLQNSIVYIAISNLDAATFQVTYQLKILTTVLFSITLLGKRISWRQCLALLLLTFGIGIVQAPEAFLESSTLLAYLKSRLPIPFLRNSASRTLPLLEVRLILPEELDMPEDSFSEHPAMNPSRGLLALFSAAMISGITGVYFEKVLKASMASVSIWTRNAQLSFYSIFPALIIGVLWQDGKEILRSGFCAGYGPLVWATIMLQASGGIIVAVCITYADNIEKNFATSISIVLSCFASVWFFDTPLTSSVSSSSVQRICLTWDSLPWEQYLSCWRYTCIINIIGSREAQNNSRLHNLPDIGTHAKARHNLTHLIKIFK